jgi:hypothetical protein
MAMTTTPPHDDTEFECSGRRRKITKFALGGVAVLGVGAALTSAAWSDKVWFGGDADSAAFQRCAVRCDRQRTRLALPAAARRLKHDVKRSAPSQEDGSSARHWTTAVAIR